MRSAAGWYERWGKRSFDVAASAAALVVLSPVLAAVAITVAATMGRPVLFRQRRTGAGGRPFDILKFRTMRDSTDGRGRPLPDEERLTRVGGWLRSSSLDELPELVNILRGEMSLVGPRPLLPRYDELYSSGQARRLYVRPGITGWAQVNGRNALAWPQRLACDGWYVDNISLGLDARIIWRTVRAVLTRQGINAADGALVTAFAGEADLPPDFDPGRPG